MTNERDFPVSSKPRDAARMQLQGIGPTTVTILVASIGNGHDFKNGRRLSAWLGLGPKQHSSGGKAKLRPITKAGDRYFRTLLVLGARAVLMHAQKRDDPVRRWRWICSKGEATAGLWWP